ncbi:unnamed protein product [Calicophoron daubneyi]|uniref:Uncharacterized protein n=1 Tax=Calicophoron daubneyi TaxID=300641 RepID=A0AAV2T396_CALDB
MGHSGCHCHCGNTCRLVSMMILVAVYFLVELVTGYVINSIALQADAFHMLSDFMALIVGVIATRIAKWPSSSKNTFGWQRAEVMGGLINTVVLITLCFTIFIDALKRFAEPERIDNPLLMIYVGAGGLLINILGLLVLGVHSHEKGHTIEVEQPVLLDGVGLEGLQEDETEGAFLEIDPITSPASPPNGGVLADGKISKAPVGTNQVSPFNNSGHLNTPPGFNINSETGKKAKQSKSMNMRAVFLHVLADFFGSVIVVISAMVLYFFKEPDQQRGWQLYVDPAMSVLMVILILASAIPLMYKAALILLQSVPNEISLKNLKERMEKIEGVRRIHDLHVWRLQSNVIIGTVHLRCVNLPDYLRLLRDVKQLFHEFDIHCTTIQPEFSDYLEPKRSSEIDYRTCVLPCDANERCGSEQCCPAGTNSHSSANLVGQMGSGKGQKWLAIPKPKRSHSDMSLDVRIRIPDAQPDIVIDDQHIGDKTCL